MDPIIREFKTYLLRLGPEMCEGMQQVLILIDHEELVPGLICEGIQRVLVLIDYAELVQGRSFA